MAQGPMSFDDDPDYRPDPGVRSGGFRCIFYIIALG